MNKKTVWFLVQKFFFSCEKGVREFEKTTRFMKYTSFQGGFNISNFIYYFVYFILNGPAILLNNISPLGKNCIRAYAPFP